MFLLHAKLCLENRLFVSDLKKKKKKKIKDSTRHSTDFVFQYVSSLYNLERLHGWKHDSI